MHLLPFLQDIPAWLLLAFREVSPFQVLIACSSCLLSDKTFFPFSNFSCALICLLKAFRPQIRSIFQARPPDHLAHGPRPPRIRTGFRLFPSSWGLHLARCRGLNRSPKAPRASGGRFSALPPGFGPSGASAASSRPFLSPYGAFLVYFHIPPSPHFAKKGSELEMFTLATGQNGFLEGPKRGGLSRCLAKVFVLVIKRHKIFFFCAKAAAHPAQSFQPMNLYCAGMM